MHWREGKIKIKKPLPTFRLPFPSLFYRLSEPTSFPPQNSLGWSPSYASNTSVLYIVSILQPSLSVSPTIVTSSLRILSNRFVKDIFTLSRVRSWYNTPSSTSSRRHLLFATRQTHFSLSWDSPQSPWVILPPDLSSAFRVCQLGQEVPHPHTGCRYGLCSFPPILPQHFKSVVRVSSLGDRREWRT